MLLVVLGAGYYIIQRDDPIHANDGFIAFQPDVSQFPAAPVADARTVVGVGRPLGWPDDRDGCPYRVVDFYEAPAIGTGWHTVRHDWSDEGDAKAWFISERTVGFEEVAGYGSYDDYVQGFRDVVTYCGWRYEDTWWGFNSIATELDGLPDDALAFKVGVAPSGTIREDDFDGSNADDFHALGALVPGPRRGEMMNVMWVSWGIDVPVDEFVSAVNTLYDAAAAAPRRDETVGDDSTIDFSFTEFDMESAGILPLMGGGRPEDRTTYSPDSPPCGRWFPDARIWEYSAVSNSDATDGMANDLRVLTFGASRWSERSRYLEAKDLAVALAASVCIDSYQPPSLLIEPISVPGLPEGATVGTWNEYRGAYAAVLYDDDKQMIMTVTWIERSGPVPEEKFVEIVNRAWDHFQADNP